MPPTDLKWLIQHLLHDEDEVSEEERFVAWQKELGEPGPGYEEWFKAGVEEALADASGDTAHDDVVKEIGSLIRRARETHR